MIPYIFFFWKEKWSSWYITTELEFISLSFSQRPEIRELERETEPARTISYQNTADQTLDSIKNYSEEERKIIFSSEVENGKLSCG